MLMTHTYPEVGAYCNCSGAIPLQLPGCVSVSMTLQTSSNIPKVCRLLLSSNADANAVGPMGRTASAAAKHSGYPALAEILTP